MFEIKIKDANGKKKRIDLPNDSEARNKLKKLEFEKKLLERDIQVIGDKKTLEFAKKRLEEVEMEIKLIEAIKGGERGDGG